MVNSVFGLVKSREQADRVVNKLLQSGFSNDEISILFSDKDGLKMNPANYPRTEGFRQDEVIVQDDGVVKRDDTFRKEDSNFRKDDLNFRKDDMNTRIKQGSLITEKHTKAPEGSTTGGVVGGLLGGSIGLLAGLGTLAIPGLGPFIAAGPIIGALSGLGLGGAVGLIVGALIGLGIPEYEAKKYDSELRKGGILLCVHAIDSKHEDLAKDILEKEHVSDIACAHEKAGSR